MIHSRTPLLSVTKLLMSVLLVLLVAGAFLACDNIFSSSDSNDKDNGNGDNGEDILTSVPVSRNGTYASDSAPTVAVLEIAEGKITLVADGTQAFPLSDGGTSTHHFSETVCRAELNGADVVRYTRDADTGHIEQWNTGGSTLTYVPVESVAGDGRLGQSFTLPAGSIGNYSTLADELQMYWFLGGPPMESPSTRTAPADGTLTAWEVGTPDTSVLLDLEGQMPPGITVTPAGAKGAVLGLDVVHTSPNVLLGGLVYAKGTEEANTRVMWLYVDQDASITGIDPGQITWSAELSHGWNSVVIETEGGTGTATVAALPDDLSWYMVAMEGHLGTSSLSLPGGFINADDPAPTWSELEAHVHSHKFDSNGEYVWASETLASDDIVLPRHMPELVVAGAPPLDLRTNEFGGAAGITVIPQEARYAAIYFYLHDAAPAGNDTQDSAEGEVNLLWSDGDTEYTVFWSYVDRDVIIDGTFIETDYGESTTFNYEGVFLREGWNRTLAAIEGDVITITVDDESGGEGNWQYRS